jgi:hypothetical protein
MKGEGPCKTVRVGPAATISLFIGKLFPDVQLNFPVQLCRELLGKRLNLVVDLDACIAAERRIGRNSLFNSLLPREFALRLVRQVTVSATNDFNDLDKKICLAR